MRIHPKSYRYGSSRNEKMRYRKNCDTAVSPVVGVMLMLIVVIIIAAVVSGFAGNLVSGNKNKDPSLTLDLDIANSGHWSNSYFKGEVTSVSAPIDTKNLKIVTSWSKTFPNGSTIRGGATTTPGVVNTNVIYDTHGGSGYDLWRLTVPYGYGSGSDRTPPRGGTSSGPSMAGVRNMLFNLDKLEITRGGAITNSRQELHSLPGRSVAKYPRRPIWGQNPPSSIQDTAPSKGSHIPITSRAIITQVRVNSPWKVEQHPAAATDGYSRIRPKRTLCRMCGFPMLQACLQDGIPEPTVSTRYRAFSATNGKS